MRVIIAGSRNFTCYPTLYAVSSYYLQNVQAPVIVCGHARGADSLGLRFAKEKGFAVQSFYPQWQRFGRAAGVIRNQQMAQFANALILFWCGRSKGSAHMLKQAQKQGLPVRVFYTGQLLFPCQLGQPF